LGRASPLTGTADLLGRARASSLRYALPLPDWVRSRTCASDAAAPLPSAHRERSRRCGRWRRGLSRRRGAGGEPDPRPSTDSSGTDGRSTPSRTRPRTVRHERQVQSVVWLIVAPNADLRGVPRREGGVVLPPANIADSEADHGTRRPQLARSRRSHPHTPRTGRQALRVARPDRTSRHALRRVFPKSPPCHPPAPRPDGRGASPSARVSGYRGAFVTWVPATRYGQSAGCALAALTATHS
jgi:hypothetical protein